MADHFYTVALEGGNELFTINQKYKIIRKVGSGSYGSVCSAIQLDTNEVVAIKKCFRIFDKPLITKRCLREVKLLRHFNHHPRIINLRDVDIVDPHHFNEIYLIQDCCDTTMADIIHSRLELEPVHYQWFMYQIFSGLKYIHSANVLHRDLKPANILVNQNCDLRICDFGMARGFSTTSSPTEPHRMTRYVVTRWYRAPEIMLSLSTYDKAIDIWSAGCIFAELLGRKVLFKGTDYVDQLHKIVGIIGLPRDTSFWDGLASQQVIEYIKNLRDASGRLPPEEPIDFGALFPSCSPEGIDLLTSMLRLDPAKRITAQEALEHPFVEQMRDPADEVECDRVFDFESFEKLEHEDEMRACLVQEMLQIKGRIPPLGDRSMMEGAAHSQAAVPHTHMPSPPYADAPPRRRYTGSTIHTPTSMSAAEAHSNAIHAIQQGLEFPVQSSTQTQSLIVGSDHFYGEPEAMDEDDRKMLDSDESISVDDRRKLVGPSGADVQALERHLSREW